MYPRARLGQDQRALRQGGPAISSKMGGDNKDRPHAVSIARWPPAGLLSLVHKDIEGLRIDAVLLGRKIVTGGGSL